MSDVVLAALIGAAASIVVNLITLIGQNNKRKTDEAVKEGIQKDMGEIQTDIAVIKNEVKNLRQQT